VTPARVWFFTNFLIIRQSHFLTSRHVCIRDDQIVFCLLSDPILFMKNHIRMRSESWFGWNHTNRFQKLCGSALLCTTNIFVLCLFYLMSQNNCWSNSDLSWTPLAVVVTRQFWNACPAQLTVTSVTAQFHLHGQVLSWFQGLQAVSSFLFALHEL